MYDIKLDLYDKKYTILYNRGPYDQGGCFKALCYGERWRDLTGDGMVLSLVIELDEAKKELEALKKKIAELETNPREETS